MKNDFVSIFDGSHYALNATEDFDPQLYEKIGTDITLDELVRRMIDRGSNLSTNLAIELIGAPRIMALMKPRLSTRRRGGSRDRGNLQSRVAR